MNLFVAFIQLFRKKPSTVRFSTLFAFFIPLGVSASLVTISHVIINSTLARAAQPELIIASYAIAGSLLGITEKPAVLLRQTCSALVRDRISFKAMTRVTWVVFLWIMAIGLIVSYTPVGRWVFLYFFGVKSDQVNSVIGVYRILMFVSIFSSIRCLFHGIIIYNKKTTWLTIGMVIRLVVMYGISRYFIFTDQINSAKVGAIIFLSGMVIEAAVSVFNGTSLLKNLLPMKLENHPVKTSTHIFKFYRPLLYSSIIAVIVGPSINAILGKTNNMEMAIASFAVAGSVTNLVQSFFSYMHQIVLNYFKTDRYQVLRFALMIGFLPFLLNFTLGYTPVGPWFLENVMGIKHELMAASLRTIRIFMILNLVFPWLDFCNGVIMLKGQTKIMVWSQGANVTITLITLFICILATPGWNGMIGALAQSLGSVTELVVVLYVLKRSSSPASRLEGTS